jgi:hypothetical protein
MLTESEAANGVPYRSRPAQLCEDGNTSYGVTQRRRYECFDQLPLLAKSK